MHLRLSQFGHDRVHQVLADSEASTCRVNHYGAQQRVPAVQFGSRGSNQATIADRNVKPIQPVRDAVKREIVRRQQLQNAIQVTSRRRSNGDFVVHENRAS
jgi:hypothetical protein